MPIIFDIEDNLVFPDIDVEKTKKWIEKIISIQNKKTGDIAYLFCNDAKILEVNKEYLQHDYYTDIITFDYCEDDIISGDLLISLDTVKSNADLFSSQLQQELLRVIIHGIFHLCGYGDKTEEEEKQMRELEDKALELYSNI